MFKQQIASLAALSPSTPFFDSDRLMTLVKAIIIH